MYIYKVALKCTWNFTQKRKKKQLKTTSFNTHITQLFQSKYITIPQILLLAQVEIFLALHISII